MTEPLKPHEVEQSIANKQAQRTPVDNQGKPLSDDAIHARYAYDEHGRLTGGNG